MDINSISEQLQEIKQMLKQSKKVLNLNEVAEYIGYSKSHIYKLTSTNQIPHYKPNGKGLFFNKEEIDSWLLSYKIVSRNEIANNLKRDSKGDWTDFEIKDSDWPKVPEWPKEDK